MNQNPINPQQPQQEAAASQQKLNKQPAKPPDNHLRKLPGQALPKSPVLRFSPAAWAKLLFFRDYKDNEIGGFGVTAADDLLKVDEFITVKQEVSVAGVLFDDQAVADFFDAQVDAGRRPEQFARIWLHSHPGNSPEPSLTDERTFCRVFGICQWAVMFVIAQNGKTYSRLRFNVGPGGHVLIPVEVDFGHDFGPSDHEAWKAEYQANIQADTWNREPAPSTQGDSFGAPIKNDLSKHCVPEDWLEELEAMEPADRSLILDELMARSDLWQQEEVAYDW